MSPTGIRIKGIDSLKRSLEQKVKDIFSPAFRFKLGATARDLIYRRVKSGYGVSSVSALNPEKKRLAPLSSSYIERREGRAIYFTKNGKVLRIPAGSKFRFTRPKVGEFFGARRSNLTFTGQLLDAIAFEASARGIRLFIESSQRDDGRTNDEVARLVQKDRPFFTLTRDELRVLTQLIEAETRKITRRVR